MNTISASNARKNLYKILDEVKNGLKSYTITIRGVAQAVVMNPEEVAEWEETVEILSDKKLKRVFENLRSLKIWPYRIIYQYFPDIKLILINVIQHRHSVYKN